MQSNAQVNTEGLDLRLMDVHIKKYKISASSDTSHPGVVQPVSG